MSRFVDEQAQDEIADQSASLFSSYRTILVSENILDLPSLEAECGTTNKVKAMSRMVRESVHLN